MEADVVDVVEMELKYCERCGGLWLRRQGEGEIYCPPCLPKMVDLPRQRKRKLRLPAGEEVEGCCDQLFAVCCEGGEA